MCGIVAYLGTQSPIPHIVEGLRQLEYRGYDSSGLATLAADGTLVVRKAAGKLANLEARLGDLQNSPSRIAIGHTRWATHGAANDANAHPHLGPAGEVAIVHNGIIENFHDLRAALILDGGTFASDTDSESIAHLLEDAAKRTPDFIEALRTTLPRLSGAYALTIISRRHPDRLFAARRQVPLIVGIGAEPDGRNFYMVASDTAAFAGRASRIIRLRDGELAALSPDGIEIWDGTGRKVDPNIETLPHDDAVADGKGDYAHYMLKEIHQQPDVLRRVLAASLPPMLDLLLHRARRVVITGCGTSLNAGLVGRHMIEDLAGVPCTAEAAGELRYRNPHLGDGDLVIALSQSGETADTLAALRMAKGRGAVVLALTNRPDSSIAREADLDLPIHAGLERSVAATKSFSAQTALLTRIALRLAQLRGTAGSWSATLEENLRALPHALEKMLADTEAYRTIAAKHANAHSLIFIARGAACPIAFEGALKLKEISYIHAEGYAAAELKHGPLALLTPLVPVVALLADGPVFDKTLSNCQEAAARGAPVIAIANRAIPAGQENIFDAVIRIPHSAEALSPILLAVATHLLSYEMALYLGREIDQPRNLAKSVTVE